MIDGSEIFCFQFRIIFKDLLLRHACGQPSQDIPDGDAEISNARLS